MTRCFLLAVFFLSLAGCYEREYSAELTEQGTVEDTIFSPSQHGSGVGMTMKGNVTVTSIDVAEVYAVVFQCEHGKFVIQGSKAKHKLLWQKLKKGQQVTILYREAYNVDKKKGEKILVKYEFIDAS